MQPYPNKTNHITIGILGGMSAVATAQYYELINRLVQAVLGGHNLPELLISSVNFGKIADCIHSENWEEAATYLTEKAMQLEKAGVDAIFMATNTMHKVQESIKSQINISFIDIFDTVAIAAKKKGLQKLALLGTMPVMTDSFFVEAYKKVGIEIITPSLEDKKAIHRIIFDELTNNRFITDSKQRYIDTIHKLSALGAEGVIFGCTEITLLLGASDIPEIPIFDTTGLHCQRAADIYLGKELLNKHTYQ